jgi:hypothetical protein
VCNIVTSPIRGYQWYCEEHNSYVADAYGCLLGARNEIDSVQKELDIANKVIEAYKRWGPMMISQGDFQIH